MRFNDCLHVYACLHAKNKHSFLPFDKINFGISFEFECRLQFIKEYGVFFFFQQVCVFIDNKSKRIPEIIALQLANGGYFWKKNKSKYIYFGEKRHSQT